MLEQLEKRIKSFSKLSIGKIVFEILKNDIHLQAEILNLNRLDQLFDKGIDSTGEIIGLYSDRTDFLSGGKKAFNTPYTLFDKGDFYNSFDLMVTTTFINITANPIKVSEGGDKVNLFDEYGKEILGLTTESRDKLVQMLIPRIERYINARIFN